ncbi:MAG: glycosyltransferase family 2 protein [bacterium]|nr:glycosyltransferase family 2 protein [bacterium]
MGTFQTVIVYFFLFVGIYFEVFILFTYLINKASIHADGKKSFERKIYPSVTIVVPIWNEEKTVQKTISSLLALNYPKDQLKIVIVDDGSTDNSWNVIQQYTDNPQIELYQKENGGKHTAVNYAIERCTTEFIGCLDADSYVDPDTLKKIICRFEDPENMAVTPAMKIHSPATIVQSVQSVEYLFGILVKKIMSILGGIHVTPGPFTIFRKSAFDKIGMFKKAHNTEDMEIAFRLQAHRMKIDNVHNAWVYTTGPNTFIKLYRQRLRWTHGFIMNVWDYRYLFMNRKYGTIGLLTLPTAVILLTAVVFSVFFLLFHIGEFLGQKFIEIKTIGLLWPQFEFSLFYVSTKLNIFLTGFVFALMFTLVYNAQKLTNEKISLLRILYYFCIYPIISPFWVIKSVYNAILAKKTTWR